MDTDSNYTETLEKTVRDLLERQEDLIRTAFTDQLTGLGMTQVTAISCR